MTGAQPILTYTVLYTYVIFVMLHWYVIGLCGLVVRMLGPVSQSHGRTTILRSSYDATFIFSRLSCDRFTKLVVKGS